MSKASKARLKEEYAELLEYQRKLAGKPSTIKPPTVRVNPAKYLKPGEKSDVIVTPIEQLGRPSSRPLINKEVTRRNFAYQASAEFVAESFKTANTERHNHDDISVQARHEHELTQGKREQLAFELAESEKKKAEERVRQRVALRAMKKSQGLAEVVIGCIVTVLHVKGKEQIRYYVAPAEKHSVHGVREAIEQSDTPPPGADQCLRADSALGKALIYAFVQDEVEVHANGGVYTCRILSVQAVQVQKVSKPPKKVRKPSPRSGDDQSHTAIGSETYNFVARDNGKFGSFSKHDDYGDESDAEGEDIDVWYTLDHL